MQTVDSPTRGVLAATFASATVIAHLVAAKAARDALLLAGFGITALPKMMMLGAVVSLLTAIISARVMERHPPLRLLLGALMASAALYALEWSLIAERPREVALILYVHVSAFGATLVAALWSLVNERFDPHEAKHEIARVALGGSFGGVLGGIAGWLVSGARGLPFFLMMLGVLNLVTIGVVLEIGRSGRLARARPRPEPTRRVPALRALRSSSYLVTLAALVALSSLSSALLDYVLSARLVATNNDAARLAAFFALFHASVGLVAMLVQLTLTRVSLERLGLAGTVALVPGAVLVMGSVGLVFPQLWSAMLLRGSEALVQASLSRSAYELLYTPLPRELKRPTKMLIDVGVDRLGTVAGAGLTALIVSALSVRGVRVIVALAMCMAVAALFCASRLNRGYIEALAGRLRRAPELDPSRGFEPATHRTLAESAALDQDVLLEAVERKSSRAANDTAARGEPPDRRDTVLVGPTGAGFEVAPGYVGLQLGSAASLSPGDVSRDDDPLLKSIRELRSGSSQLIRPVLAAPLSPQLAVHVIPLLGSDDVARDALRALRGAAPRIVGALADALLDLESNVVVRRRIPRALERCSTPRSIQALVEGLFDPELDVRSQCALALLRAVELDPNAALPRERILDAIEAELWREEPLLAASRSADALDDQPGFGAADLRERVHQGVEQVMTLLALMLEREPVRLAYHALYSDDVAIRGTALEYLDNVLPDRIRPGVLALVQGPSHAVPVREPRNRTALVDELQRARERLIPPARPPRRESTA
jgi:ATP:ADP antiporter, AAA family